MRILILALMMLMPFAASAKDVCQYDRSFLGGDDNPWPWGRESRFPWLAIQGVWVPVDGDCNSLFVFKTKSVQGENRIVQIVQYDPTTCERLAWGAGVESEQILRASMVNKDGKSFDLTIRAFDESTVSTGALSTLPSALRNIVVLSMYPKGDWERRMSYQMQKVTDVPVMLCDSKNPVF